jgi:hypothetical protein
VDLRCEKSREKKRLPIGQSRDAGRDVNSSFHISMAEDGKSSCYWVTRPKSKYTIENQHDTRRSQIVGSALMLRHMQKSYGLCSELLPRVLLSSHHAVSMCRHHHAKISNYGLAGVVGQICQLIRCRSVRPGRQKSNALLQTRQCIDDL